MKSTFLLSSALVLALASGAWAQSAPSGSGAKTGTTVGPATGKPDVPPEPPAAKVQQPGKEGMQAQSAAPGGAGTSVGPAAGSPDIPSEPPSAKVQQPAKQAAGATNPSGSQAQAVPGQQGSGALQQGMNQQGTTSEDGTGRQGHVTSTHELKQALQQQGFSDVRILAESFVVQAMKDGRRVTMMLGPNGLDAVQIVDERGLQDEDTTGTVSPGGGTGSPSGEAPQQ